LRGICGRKERKYINPQIGKLYLHTKIDNDNNITEPMCL